VTGGVNPVGGQIAATMRPRQLSGSRYGLAGKAAATLINSDARNALDDLGVWMAEASRRDNGGVAK
jgi:hypothetical protein